MFLLAVDDDDGHDPSTVTAFKWTGATNPVPLNEKVDKSATQIKSPT